MRTDGIYARRYRADHPVPEGGVALGQCYCAHWAADHCAECGACQLCNDCTAFKGA